MITQFRQLFALSVTHNYYGGACPDFGFAILDDTVRVLRGARLFAKAVDSRLLVFYEADAGGAAPLVSAAGARLRFGLVLNNASLPNFTLLPISPRGAALVYDNHAAAATLGPADPVRLASAVFAHTLTGTTRPVTVTALRGGGVFRSETIADARTAATFDLRGVDPGRFEVRETFGAGTTHDTPYYLDPQSQREGVFAIVEIAVGAGFYATAADFQIAFTAKEQPLRYYVVVSNYSAADVGALGVEDAGFVEEQRPQIAFAAAAPDAAMTATLAVPGGTLLLFESQAPVRRRALGRRKVQLKKNNDAVIENLPQPAATNPTADLIVHLSKPKRP